MQKRRNCLQTPCVTIRKSGLLSHQQNTSKADASESFFNGNALENENLEKDYMAMACSEKMYQFCLTTSSEFVYD